MTTIQRKPVPVQSGIVVETEVENSTAFSNEASGGLKVRRTSGTTATMDIYGAEEVDGTYLQLSFQNTDLSIAVSASKWEILPAATYASPWIKFVGDAAGVVEVAGKG